jgi:hypothetical protein
MLRNPPTDWIEVTSSNIARVAYVNESARLYVQFHSGVAWCYRPITNDVFVEFMAAKSQGQYFNAVIKHGFHAERVYV